MHLADHIRPLLRDHDCVIIPGFGGLVADAEPARRQPGRHVFSPPRKLVAFNQALTRNDGLLVDALAQYLNIPATQAREVLREAVGDLHHDLDATNRTELPGIGVFRRAAGRGLAFEYTGTDNLLPAAYGLPELAARPVRATDVIYDLNLRVEYLITPKISIFVNGNNLANQQYQRFYRYPVKGVNVLGGATYTF